MQKEPVVLTYKNFYSNSQRVNVNFKNWNLTFYIFENDVFASYKTVAMGMGLGRAYNKTKAIVENNNKYVESVIRVARDNSTHSETFTSLMRSDLILNISESANTKESLEFANLILNILTNLKEKKHIHFSEDATSVEENLNTDNSELHKLRKLGLSMSGILVLNYLQQYGLTPLRKIADACDLSVSSVEKALAKLKKIGLLSKNIPQKTTPDHSINDMEENDNNERTNELLAQRITNALSTSEKSVLMTKIIEKIDKLDASVQLELVKSILY